MCCYPPPPHKHSQNCKANLVSIIAENDMKTFDTGGYLNFSGLNSHRFASLTSGS